jgi:hypothetical protein
MIAKSKVISLEVYAPVSELQDFLQNYLLLFSVYIGYKLKYHFRLISLETASKMFVESQCLKFSFL